jgi:hypothetical protein
MVLNSTYSRNRGELGLTLGILTVESELCVVNMYLCTPKPSSLKWLLYNKNKMKAEVIYDLICKKYQPNNTLQKLPSFQYRQKPHFNVHKSNMSKYPHKSKFQNVCEILFEIVPTQMKNLYAKDFKCLHHVELKHGDVCMCSARSRIGGRCRNCMMWKYITCCTLFIK